MSLTSGLVSQQFLGNTAVLRFCRQQIPTRPSHKKEWSCFEEVKHRCVFYHLTPLARGLTNPLARCRPVPPLVEYRPLVVPRVAVPGSDEAVEAPGVENFEGLFKDVGG